MDVHTVFVPAKSSHSSHAEFLEIWRFGSKSSLDLCCTTESLFEVEEHSWAINPNGTRAREYASTQKPGGREFCSHADYCT